MITAARSIRPLLLAALFAVATPVSALAEHLWHDVPIEGKQAGSVTAVIEIAKGSKNKNEVDKQTGQVALDRKLLGPRGLPQKYGLIPQTLSGDGDPLDVIVFGGNDAEPGAKVDVRIIGMMEMTDSGDRDTKLLAVDAQSRKFAKVKNISGLAPVLKADLKTFFETYKIPEGKKVTVGRFLSRRAAQKELRDSASAYRQKFGGKAPPTRIQAAPSAQTRR